MDRVLKSRSPLSRLKRRRRLDFILGPSSRWGCLWSRRRLQDSSVREKIDDGNWRLCDEAVPYDITILSVGRKEAGIAA